MPTSFDFPPSAVRAAHLDRQMHTQLARSLRHVCDRTRGVYRFDEPAIDRLIAALDAGAGFSPVTFSCYYDLVLALLDEDEPMVGRMFEALASARPVQKRLRVLALGSPELGGDVSARYEKRMNSEEDLGLLPPSHELARDFTVRLDRGFRLLERAMPELAGEIHGIVREVVIVAGDRTKKYQFDGGSHFQLWGALFLNAEYHQTDYAIVEVLAHESAHTLLFGFCTEEALVENADDELYPSPLRSDPRPMDGIYHATFVSARMHWAMSRLLESDLLDRTDSELARKALMDDARNFEAGYQVVAAHGRLTATGRALMEGARAYMDAAGAGV